MSRLRPTLVSTNRPATATGTAAYLVLHETVRRQWGLLHGKLDGPAEKGEHCAIGWYFEEGDCRCLPNDFIDEIAAVNDSVPDKTPRQRRLHVLRYLRWKLAQRNYPGFTRWRIAAPPATVPEVQQVNP